VRFASDGFVSFDGFDRRDDVDASRDASFARKTSERAPRASRDVISRARRARRASIARGDDDDGVDDQSRVAHWGRRARATTSTKIRSTIVRVRGTNEWFVRMMTTLKLRAANLHLRDGF
jgi:hypothetical protein